MAELPTYFTSSVKTILPPSLSLPEEGERRKKEEEEEEEEEEEKEEEEQQHTRTTLVDRAKQVYNKFETLDIMYMTDSLPDNYTDHTTCMFTDTKLPDRVDNVNAVCVKLDPMYATHIRDECGVDVKHLDIIIASEHAHYIHLFHMFVAHKHRFLSTKLIFPTLNSILGHNNDGLLCFFVVKNDVTMMQYVHTRDVVGYRLSSYTTTAATPISCEIMSRCDINTYESYKAVVHNKTDFVDLARANNIYGVELHCPLIGPKTIKPNNLRAVAELIVKNYKKILIETFKRYFIRINLVSVTISYASLPNTRMQMKPYVSRYSEVIPFRIQNHEDIDMLFSVLGRGQHKLKALSFVTAAYDNAVCDQTTRYEELKNAMMLKKNNLLPPPHRHYQTYDPDRGKKKNTTTTTTMANALNVTRCSEIGTYETMMQLSESRVPFFWMIVEPVESGQQILNMVVQCAFGLVGNQEIETIIFNSPGGNYINRVNKLLRHVGRFHPRGDRIRQLLSLDDNNNHTRDLDDNDDDDDDVGDGGGGGGKKPITSTVKFLGCLSNKLENLFQDHERYIKGSCVCYSNLTIVPVGGGRWCGMSGRGVNNHMHLMFSIRHTTKEKTKETTYTTLCLHYLLIQSNCDSITLDVIRGPSMLYNMTRSSYTANVHAALRKHYDNHNRMLTTSIQPLFAHRLISIRFTRRWYVNSVTTPINILQHGAPVSQRSSSGDNKKYTVVAIICIVVFIVIQLMIRSAL